MSIITFGAPAVKEVSKLTEIYLPLDEVSRLECINYDTLKKRLMRNSEYKTKRESSDNGGKERILIGFSSLSPKAKKAYKAKQEVETIVKSNDDEIPWYLETDINWYMNNYNKHFYKAIDFTKLIEQYLMDCEDTDNKETLASTYAAKEDMSTRSFYRKVKAYLNAVAWSEKMYENDGQNYDYFKALALSKKPIKSEKFISLTEEMKVFIENIWFDKSFAINQNFMVRIHEALLVKSNEKGWEAPSYPTVTRYINYLNKVHGNKRELLVKGEKKFKGDHMLKGERDTGALEVMEFVMGDGHTFDCWVTIKKGNGKIDAVRPHLLAWIDLKSRCIVSHSICDVPDSHIMAKTLINMIYPKKDENIPFEGCPKYLYIDNGKEYTAEYLTGRKRNIRFDFDAETKGFYKSIGIEDDVRALPYNSWAKAEIERYFGTVSSMFTKTIDSYVGTLTGSKTAAKVKKDIPKMLEKGQLMSIEEFSELFNKWLMEVYHTRKHSGLKKQKEPVPVPIEVYKNADRYYKAAPPMEYAETQLMKIDEATVYGTGIRRFGVDYTHERLGQFINNQKVMIRYNPDDMSKIYVYDLEGKKICEAVAHELIQIAPKLNSKQLEEHMRIQRRQLRETKDDLKYLQMSYEERMAAKEKINIMPELKSDNPKIVSLPEDKEYRNNFKHKNDRDDIENDYFTKIGEKVFEELAQII